MTDTLSAVLRERDAKRERIEQRDRDSENPAGREQVNFHQKASPHANVTSCQRHLMSTSLPMRKPHKNNFQNKFRISNKISLKKPNRILK